MQLQADIQSLEGAYNPASEELKEINLKPKSTNMSLRIFGLAWMPYRKDRGGRLSPDWS